MTLDSLSFLEKKPTAKQVAVFNIPLDLGKDNIGTDSGPKAIREAGFMSMLSSLGVDVFDGGTVPCATRRTAKKGAMNMKYAEAIVVTAEESAARVATAVAQGRVAIALGGDHSLSLGTISGASVALGGDLGVIWIDAHGDINTDVTTVSGNIHGMPLAGVLGMGHASLVNILKPGQKVQPKNVVYAGLKDLDQAEIDIIRKHKISTTTAMDIARVGLEPLFKNILALQKRVKRIWVSLDVDSIDAEYAPGTPMENRGGLTYREITAIASFIGKTCQLAGFDIVELAPRHDKAGKTAKLAVELASRLLGGDYSWYSDYMTKSSLKKPRATK